MTPITRRNHPGQSPAPTRQLPLRVRLSVAVFALSTLCFAAAFVLGIFSRAGLTQFVSAGLFLTVLGSRVATGKSEGLFPKRLPPEATSSNAEAHSR